MCEESHDGGGYGEGTSQDGGEVENMNVEIKRKCRITIESWLFKLTYLCLLWSLQQCILPSLLFVIAKTYVNLIQPRVVLLSVRKLHHHTTTLGPITIWAVIDNLGS